MCLSAWRGLRFYLWACLAGGLASKDYESFSFPPVFSSICFSNVCGIGMLGSAVAVTNVGFANWRIAAANAWGGSGPHVRLFLLVDGACT